MGTQFNAIGLELLSDAFCRCTISCLVPAAHFSSETIWSLWRIGMSLEVGETGLSTRREQRGLILTSEHGCLAWSRGGRVKVRGSGKDQCERRMVSSG